jgi:hypothetical protein
MPLPVDDEGLRGGQLDSGQQYGGRLAREVSMDQQHPQQGAGSEAVRPPSFPQYSIALVQNESEMLKVPEYDISAYFENDDRWNVDLFTERTVGALVEGSASFDCIVIGYNAIHKSPQILPALRDRPLAGGLLVLHQLSESGFSFLTGELELRAVKLLASVDHVSVVADLKPTDEILLSWPEPVQLREERSAPGGDPLHGLDATAHFGLAPGPRSDWRTVLQAEGRRRLVPVLVRSRTGRWPPVAATTVLLAPRRPAHRNLLTNLLLWCAAGSPDAVVLEVPDSSRASALHRKLRLQGVRAIAHRAQDPSELDFDAWPYRGTESVMLPPDWDPTAKAEWPGGDSSGALGFLQRGGRLLVQGPGHLTVRYGESDPEWVAAHWARWFQATPRVTWHGGAGSSRPGSLGQTLAVLRVLSVLRGVSNGGISPGQHAVRRVLDEMNDRAAGIDCERLNLEEPTEYLEPVSRLLRRRIGKASSVEETVSATVAALEIDGLLGRAALEPEVRGRLEGWLRSSFEDLEPVDQLEIARVLPGSEFAKRALKAARDVQLTPVLIISLREAIVASGVGPGDAEDVPQHAAVRTMARLRSSPVLAANYLLSLADLEAHWDGKAGAVGHLLINPPVAEVDQAVLGLGRHGALLQPGGGEQAADAELMGAEALALIAYFGRDPVPTHSVAPEGKAASHVLAAAFEEAHELRRENEELVHRAESLELSSRLARVAGPLAIVAGVALLLMLVAAAWWLVATQTHTAFAFEFALFTLMASVGTLCVLAGVGALGYRTRLTEVAGDLLRGPATVKERLAAWTAPSSARRDEGED